MNQTFPYLKRPLPGFTLIETIASSFIISMVILGPLSLAIHASSYSKVTKDTLTATYLAQEAIELLHHQQDSIFIRCVQEAGSFCNLEVGETYSQAAWRLFRSRLDSTSGVSCFSDENRDGCSFDFIDMTGNEDAVPTKYVSTASACNSLSIEDASNLYVCSGAHGSGTGYSPTRFSRSISITSIPTYGSGTSEQNYNDDLRITVTVTFTQVNGYNKQIQVVDFLHARS